MVNGLPFFDHAALLTLRHASPWWNAHRRTAFPVFGLRLLDASGCTNATSTGLAEALPHFPDLVSLDLSRTPGARSEVVLSKLQYLRSLRVLNLEGLGLKDTDFSVVATSIGTRVRSLNVSGNHLTDASARLLLEHCLKEVPVQEHVARTPLPPVEHGRLSGDPDEYQSEDLVSHLRQRLTRGFAGRLAIEESRHIGITHLYLSRNSVTVEGISGLLRSKRLRVLDVGVLPAVLTSLVRRTWDNEDGEDSMELPGVAKMTPVLSDFAAARLRYLRVNYEIVTEDAPTEALPSPRAELDGNLGRYTPTNAHELETPQHRIPIELDNVERSTSIPELSSINNAVSELPGSSAFPVELPGSFPIEPLPAKRQSSNLTRTPSIKVTSEPQVVKRGAAYAPEPVLVDSPMPPVSPLLPGNENRRPFSTGGSTLDHGSALSPILASSRSSVSSETLGRRSRHNSTHFVEDRQARLELRQSQENRLHPGMLPKVHTLVLTDVPTSSNDPDLVHRLIQYIKDAAEEAWIAKKRAKHTYMLPPGRSRNVAEREHARGLFALKRIIFEMAPPQVQHKKISTSWRAYPSKSSTEDADSEAFWEAATHDFSFFDDEECGVPTREPGRGLPLAAMGGLELAVQHHAPPPRPRKIEPAMQPQLDVAAEIGKFRRARKAVYNNLLIMGEADPEVEGYWPGDVTVVRKPADEDAGELDCYGNRYQGWGLYR
jgi:Leucine-rich repeat (LRR) protein